MTYTVIKAKCSRRTGTGISDSDGEDSSPGTCSKCGGIGYLETGRNFNIANIFQSHIILEELDATEHAALTDAQKDGVLHILACGKVDLRDGKAGKTRLWNWSGAESTTVANLTALLT